MADNRERRGDCIMKAAGLPRRSRGAPVGGPQRSMAMVDRIHEHHGTVGQSAERQMRMWSLGREVLERVGHEQAAAPVPERTHPFVCISREAGAGGEAVARDVADQLGWQLLDRELIHQIAEHGGLSETMLELLDEGRWNWIVEVFGSWLQRGLINQAGYLHRLEEVLAIATRHAPCVIVGRGAQYLLPREYGVAVRVIAPRETRIRRTMEERGCDHAAATAWIDKIDAARHEFAKRSLQRDPADPHVYDLVINTGVVDIASAADLVAALCRRRFSTAVSRPAPAPAQASA
jgi:cytidylate kinase